MCSENKGADRFRCLILRSWSAPLFSHIDANCWFSHAVAHILRRALFPDAFHAKFQNHRPFGSEEEYF